MRPLIAIVDDALPMLKALGRLLRAHDYDVGLFSSGEELVAGTAASAFDCVVLDLHLPGLSGLEVLESLRTRASPPPTIVITGQDEPRNAGRVFALGASAYLLKPVDETELVQVIRKVLQDSGGASRNRNKPKFNGAGSDVGTC